MPDADKGLFLVNNLMIAGSNKAIKQAVCRIGEASLMTAGGLCYNRLLMYKVHFWVAQPQTIEDYAGFQVFKDPRTGSTVFTTTIALKQYGVEDITSIALQHFLSVVLAGRKYTPSTDAMKKLKQGCDAFWPFKDEDGRDLAVWNVVHKQYFASVQGLALEQQYAKLSYRGEYVDSNHIPTEAWDWEKAKDISFDYVFEHYSLLTSAAQRHWADPAVRLATEHYFDSLPQEQ